MLNACKDCRPADDTAGRSRGWPDGRSGAMGVEDDAGSGSIYIYKYAGTGIVVVAFCGEC